MKWLFIPLFFFLGCNLFDDGSTWQQRNTWAQEWLKENHLEGTTKCFNNTHNCDVVTSDNRTPFYLICMQYTDGVATKHVCSLPHNTSF